MAREDSSRRFPQLTPGRPLPFAGMSPSRKKRTLDRMEHLEGRLYWSVGQDANGWTFVTPSANENYVYVSPTGSNSNDGKSANSPVQTLGKAESLLVNNAPNELLLQAGTRFTNDSFANWTYSGQDAQNPIVITSYGSGARPLIYTGTLNAGFATPTYSTTGVQVNYVDMLGLQFDCNSRDPTLGTVSTSTPGGGTGFYFYAKGGNVLIEDTSFNYYKYNIDIEAIGGTNINTSPSVSNISLRRDVVNNAYAFNGGRSQGMYTYSVNGISVQQCDFDHDGWNANAYLGATDIGYNHDMYFASTDSGVDVENCIVAEASYAGIMGRAGGIINNNLFIDNAVACTFGDADGADSKVGGVTGSLIGNTVVGDKASASISNNPLPFGQGFVIANTSLTGNVMVSGNLFTADTQNAKPAILLTMATGTTNAQYAVGLNNVTITNNILNGWRYGIDTDGRFSPGGSGLYALNNLKVSKNDYVNSTTVEARHDGSFSFSQESWSGDRFYDSILSQSKWVTLQSNTIAFSTWAQAYDLGATALTSLPYTDPSRTVATYDTTVGGPGTFQDYLAHAAQISITNYTTQYMATAAGSYVQGGFFVSTGGGGGGTSTGVTTINVNTVSIGATTYSFTVNFTSGYLIKTSTLATGNLLVTGPNGFSQYATYVSGGTVTTDSSGYQHTPVTYKIAAPGGAWATGKGQDGTYSIVLLPNQVSDLNGNIVPDGLLGTFSVDLTPPTAQATASNVTSLGGSVYSFSVAYSDAAGIDTSTLNSYEIQVTGPSRFTQYATLAGVAANGNGTGVVANYTIVPPGGIWQANAAGTYLITIGANAVLDVDGNPVAGGTLDTFSVASALATGSISGIAYNDANGNGVFDTAREVPLIGVTVFIDLAGTGVYAAGDPVTTTSSTGAYTFSNLTAGKYTVVETAPSGYGVTSFSGGTNVITVTAGSNATLNFGNQIGATSISSTGNGSGSGSGSSAGGGDGSSSGTGTGTGSGTGTSSGAGSGTGSGTGTGTGIGTGTGVGTSRGRGTRLMPSQFDPMLASTPCALAPHTLD